MEVLSTSTQETKKIARDLAKKIKLGNFVAIYGDLGAGKTTFVQGLAEGLKVRKKVKSPTFIFMQSYPIQINGKDTNLIHVDLYRSQVQTDLVTLGLSEVINSKNIVVLEWASKIEDNLPKKRINIKIKTVDEHARKITVTRN